MCFVDARLIGRAIRQGLTVIGPDAQGVWGVTSSKGDGTTYRVGPDPQGYMPPVCDCEAGQRQEPCKHVALVEAMIASADAVEAVA